MATDQERLDKIEEKVRSLEVESAVMKSDINTLKASITKIEGNTSKIIWLVGSTIIIAILNLIIKGGVSL